MALHVFGVVDDFGEVARFDGVEGEGQGHFAHFVMVAEGLAVGGDVDQFGPGPHVLGETGHEALDEPFAAGQQILEGDGARNGAVVEE